MQSSDIHSRLNELKKYIFYETLDLAGRVFVIVKYSDNVSLGKRGFLPEEREHGLVLVFNRQMNFGWGDSGITATLVFGGSLQKCFIPEDDMVAIYSPELNIQFIAGDQSVKEGRVEQKIDRNDRVEKIEKPRAEYKDNVVKVDFGRKK